MASKKIFCERCKKEIMAEEFRVTWKEHQIKPITIELELDFHRQCWVDKYNESLDKKVQFFAKKIMKNSEPLIKEFASRHLA